MSDTTNPLNFLQWNCRSAVSNKPNLEALLIQKNVYVAMLSETWFKPEKFYNFSGYNCFRSDRPDGYGGTAILIKNKIITEEINLLDNYNFTYTCMAVKISCIKKPIHIISVYKEPGIRVTVEEWVNFFQHIPSPFIIGGDFNAHNMAWGCENNDTHGKVLLEAIEQCNLLYLNDGSPTLALTSSPSAIDITICTQDIVSKLTWSVIQDPHGSDHLPLIIALENSEQAIQPGDNTHKRWNLHKADWNLYSSNFYSGKQPQTYEELVTEINRCATISIPKSYNNNKYPTNKIPKPWWDNNCESAANNRKTAYRHYKTNPNLHNLIEYKKLDALAKKTFKIRKKQTWINYCESLNSNTPISDVWKKVNRYKNRKQSNQLPINTEAAWIEEFHFKISPPWVPSQINEATVTVPRENFNLEKPFELWELNHGLKQNNSSSPGMDCISYSMLYFLPTEYKLLLLQIFNTIWQNKNLIPKAWKDYIVLPIKKPGKPDNKVESYRPISLSSCILKTLERLIKNRLEYWLESEDILPKSQYGFRKSRSTQDALTSLVSSLQVNFTNQASTAAAFIDVTSAFDNINLDILYKKLVDLGMPVKISNFIVSLYKNRWTYLKINENLLPPRLTSIGIPQGSILSPLLFSLYNIDLEHIVPPHSNILQFADDVVLYTSHSSLDICRRQLEFTLDCVKNDYHSLGLSISTTKTEICFFSKKRQIPQGTFKLGRIEFPIKNCVKYLGTYLDRKLLWKDQIHYIIKKSENSMNILRAFCRTGWGADPNIALLFYRSMIRPIFDYSCHLYGSASTGYLNKVEIQRNKCLRLCLGYLKSTPITIIEIEAKEPPLTLRRQFCTDKFVARAISKNVSYLRTIRNLNILDLSHKYWCTKKTPIYVESYRKLTMNENQMYKNKIPLIYTKPPETLFSKVIQTNYMDSNLPGNIINKIIKDRWPMFQYIFTDGSKIQNKTGCAIYHWNSEYKESCRLPNEASIYTAELSALLLALKYIASVGMDNYIIFTDCRSIVDKLTSIQSTKNLNHIEIEIKSLYYDFTSSGSSIIICWVKGHSGILGNEEVDKLAKSAALTKQNISNILLPVTDIDNISKNHCKQNWQRVYNQSTTGINFRNCQPLIPNERWFKQESNRLFIKTINRMRSNHALTPAYKHSIGISDNPYCACGGMGDLQHLILECGLYRQNIKVMYEKLIDLNCPLPVNLNEILFPKNKQTLQCLYEYVTSCKFKF